MSRFMNSDYAALLPYVPGEQPKDRSYIKLNTNESPYSPGPLVQEAISENAISSLRLYEDPTNSELKEALSEAYGLSPDCYCPTAGSDEALELCFMAFAGAGIQYPDISYGFYSVLAGLHNISARVSPLREDFSIDIADYTESNECIVIANPNAPTGLMLGISELRAIVSSNPDRVVIVDEAYVDFGAESALPLISEFDNLVVCRTFSKSRSLAGARIGFAAANPSLIEDMERIRNSRNPYNISRLSQLIGRAALMEPEYYDANCKKIIDSRSRTITELRRLGFSVNDSYGNFLLAKSTCIGGNELYLALRSRGILVRHFTAERIRDYNRITIGAPSEMDAFIAAVEDILSSREYGKEMP